MKRINIISLIAFLTLIACSKTEIIDSGQQREIDFNVVNSAQTKANATLDKKISMGVLATFENGNSNYYLKNNKFMCRENTTSWGNVDPTSNTPLPVYWPSNANLNFTVYAPYKNISVGTDISHNTENGTFSIQHVNASDNFMYGEKIYTFNRNSGSYTVNLKHAGVLLCFKAKCSQTNVKINSITIPKGEYNATGTVNVDYKPTTTNLTWTTPTVDNQKDLVLTNSNSSTPVPSTGQDILETTETTKEGLYVIPGKQTSFIVNYQPLNADGTDFGSAINATIDLTANNATWDAGKKYTYTLNFEAYEISFTTNTENWEGPIENAIDSEGKISFSFAAGRARPAAGLSMGVQAFNEEGIYFNTEIKESDFWISNYFWPTPDSPFTGKPLKFLAYAPYSSNAQTSTPGTITLQEDISSRDLIWGSQTVSGYTNGGKNVNMDMKHAKARIILKMTCEDGGNGKTHGTHYDIKKVSLSNLVSKGEMKLTENGCEWKSLVENKTAAVFEKIIHMNSVPEFPITIGEFWAIPTTFKGLNIPTFSIEYSTLAKNTHVDYTPGIQSGQTPSLSNNTTWEANKTYTYLLTFKNGTNITCTLESQK